MASAPKVPHQVGNKIISLPDEYDAIGTICGVKKLAGAPVAGSETISVTAAIAHGLVRRATVRLDTKKTKCVIMVAANCPQVGALATLKLGATDTIKSAYFSQHIRLG